MLYNIISLNNKEYRLIIFPHLYDYLKIFEERKRRGKREMISQSEHWNQLKIFWYCRRLKKIICIHIATYKLYCVSGKFNFSETNLF